MVRPTIIVDLDNVVYDFVQSFAMWLNLNGALPYQWTTRHDWAETVIVDPVEQAMADYSQWSIWDDWNMPKGEFMRWWRLGIEEGHIYGKGPRIPGARDALWRLSDAEWNIHLVTNRLTKFGLHDKIVENTTLWLRENNIPYRELSFATDKTRILADAIVDDRLDNMYSAVHGRTFLFGAPHNEAENRRKYDWQEILEELLETVKVD